MQCTVDTLDINRSYETRHAVIGDAKLTLQALIDELAAGAAARRRTPGSSRRSAAGKQAFLAKFRPWMESNETPINPYRVIGDLMKVLDPKNSFVTADSGQHARPDQHGLRGADPARLPGLGQRLDAGLQPRRAPSRPSSRIPTGSASTSPATPASAT